MVCKVCSKDKKEVNEERVCIDCGYANATLKLMGVRPYYDDWSRVKTVDGIEYE